MNLIESFGGEGQVLHFAHANAYPIKSYTSFLHLFAESYKVVGMNQRPMWVTESADQFTDWSTLAQDLIDQLDTLDSGPVFGLGHSMGALATLMASDQRPDLFKKIVLIEPVILAEQVYAYMEKISIDERTAMNPMMNIAAKRRNHWASKDEARQYFESKSFFQKFSKQSQDDYLEHGLVSSREGGLELAYRREWESRIYGTAVNPWSYLEKIKVPCLIVRAEHSDVMRSDQEWQAIEKRAHGADCLQFDGAGHMVPMEKPVELHVMISNFLKKS